MPIPAGVIALVDDDASILRALERSLVAMGYRVKAFASAEQYLDEAQEGEIACAIIDIELGAGLSGLDLGEKISPLHATPMVFMTGSREPALRKRAMAIGCVEFLEKPFCVSSLIEAIVKVDRQDSWISR